MVNSKIDEFKLFVKANPFLITYIRDGKKSWQDLYEMYDIYGDNEEYWNTYLEDNSSKEESTRDSSKNTSNNNTSFTNHIDELIKMAKNVDVDKVQEGITSLQKTLALFGDLFANKNTPTNGYNPRPLYRRFDD